MRRRDVIKAVVSMPIAAAAGKAKAAQTKRVVLPPKATRYFEEIIKEGGTITGITINFSLPAKPGWQSWGQSFLFEEEIEGIK